MSCSGIEGVPARQPIGLLLLTVQLMLVLCCFIVARSFACSGMAILWAKTICSWSTEGHCSRQRERSGIHWARLGWFGQPSYSHRWLATCDCLHREEPGTREVSSCPLRAGKPWSRVDTQVAFHIFKIIHFFAWHNFMTDLVSKCIG